MTVHRDHHQVIFECDTCGDTYESGEGEFNEAYAAAKDEGWIAFKNDETGKWEHRCEDCKREG